MALNSDFVERSQKLVNEIAQAERLNRPIENLVRQHIAVLQEHHDEFVRQADKANIHNLQRAKTEIELYSNIIAWANKIGMPVDKYNEAIRKIRVSIIGEENTKKFFS